MLIPTFPAPQESLIDLVADLTMATSGGVERTHGVVGGTDTAEARDARLAAMQMVPILY